MILTTLSDHLPRFLLAEATSSLGSAQSQKRLMRSTAPTVERSAATPLETWLKMETWLTKRKILTSLSLTMTMMRKTFIIALSEKRYMIFKNLTALK